MLAARVPKGKAEGLRKYLKRKGLLNSKYRVFGSGEFIYFPVSTSADEKLKLKLKETGAKLVAADFSSQHHKREEKKMHGYELYGSIAVIESDAKSARAVGKSLMLSNKNIKTVLRKGSAVSGKYRTRKFLYVAGERKFIANYKENGCVFRFDIRKVFFSTKLAYERKRVSGLVRNGERVIVMFAGVGPFAIEIAKPHDKCKVVAIELNSVACRNMRENIKLNKTPNVIVEQGDVTRFAARYARFADRIVMPLPKESSVFLPAALRMSRKNCTIHYYTFCQTGKASSAIARLEELVAGRKRGFKLQAHRAVRPYSARDEEIVIDFKTN